MGIQSINDFQNENPNIIVPNGFGDSNLFNGVYVGETEEGASITGRCEVRNQEGVILKHLGEVVSIVCTNLLKNGNCAKSWDGGNGYDRCKIHDILQSIHTNAE